MQTDLQRLAALIDGWSQTDQIPDVERDLALQKLRDLYEAIRFAGPEAVQAKEVSAEAVPEVPEEELPESLDLGAVLSLDGFPDLGEPEGPIYAEPAAPFGVEVGSESTEPEPAGTESAEPEMAEPGPAETVEEQPAESAETQPAEPETAEQAESLSAEPQTAELTESAESALVESVEPQPAEPVESASVESVEPQPAEPAASTLTDTDIVTVEEQPAESAETQPAEPETAEQAESLSAEPQTAELTESAESASVEPEIPESVTLEPDAAEASVTLDSSRSAEPAAAKSHHAASPTLFGMEDEETVRHRHKQRVIMSLYGPSPEPERPAASAASGRRPSSTPGAFSPASSTSTDASQPFEIIEVERGSEALSEKATSKQTDEGPTVVEPHSAPVPADQPAEEVSEKTATPAPVESAPVESATVSTARTASAEPEPETEPEPESAAIAPNPAPESASQPSISTFDSASDATDRRTEGGMPIAPAGAVLGEVINPHVQTLADTIAPPRDMASEILHNEPITDLRQAIGLNDKFLLIRDLFGGDGAAFERAIETLNGFDDLDDCMIFIAEHYAWNPNSDGAKLLMELLERKFA